MFGQVPVYVDADDSHSLVALDLASPSQLTDALPALAEHYLLAHGGSAKAIALLVQMKVTLGPSPEAFARFLTMNKCPVAEVFFIHHLMSL